MKFNVLYFPYEKFNKEIIALPKLQINKFSSVDY